MTSVRSDLVSREAIQVLVDKFYDKVKSDDLLGPVFNHVDWTRHLPVMYNFWSSMILGDQSYRGSPLQQHLHLPIDGAHFTRWLFLFKAIVDENFQGCSSEEIKTRAENIAKVFQNRMGISFNN